MRVEADAQEKKEAASMKVPPKRKGNRIQILHDPTGVAASMKVPPKRKGNNH